MGSGLLGRRRVGVVFWDRVLLHKTLAFDSEGGKGLMYLWLWQGCGVNRVCVGTYRVNNEPGLLCGRLSPWHPFCLLYSCASSQPVCVYVSCRQWCDFVCC